MVPEHWFPVSFHVIYCVDCSLLLVTAGARKGSDITTPWRRVATRRYLRAIASTQNERIRPPSRCQVSPDLLAKNEDWPDWSFTMRPYRSIMTEELAQVLVQAETMQTAVVLQQLEEAGPEKTAYTSRTTSVRPHVGVPRWTL